MAHRRQQKPDVLWPFTKLKTEGVWLPLDERGAPTAGHIHQFADSRNNWLLPADGGGKIRANGG